MADTTTNRDVVDLLERTRQATGYDTHGPRQYVASKLGITPEQVKWAKSLQDRYPIEEELGGRRDAARHLGLGYLAARSEYPRLAEIALKLDESRYNPLNIGAPEERKQDHINNMLGYAIQAKTPAEAEEIIHQMIQDKEAVSYTPEESRRLFGYENGGEVGLEQELQFRLNDPTDYYSQLFPEETSRIEAPRYPTVAKIGQGLESFSRHLEQQSPLLSLIDPVAGIGPYLTRLGYGQKSTPLESTFAALDVAGGAGDVVGMGAIPVLGVIAKAKARKNALERADELRFFDDVKRSLEEDNRPVFPAPQRMFDPEDKDFKEFLGPMGPKAGGRYLDMSQQPPKEVTDEFPETAFISINTDGTATMKASKNTLEGEPDVKQKPGVPHRQIKTNVIEKGGGPKGRWRWSRVPKGYNKNPGPKDKIIAVKDDKHYYTLSTVYPKGVGLKRYPEEKSEPRLRPTKKGQLVLGNVVGEVIVGNEKHPIYDTVAVLGVAGAAILSEKEKEQQAYRYGGGVESLAHIARNMY